MRASGSRTAVHVALFRALETSRGDGLFRDPYAARFLPPHYRAAVRAARFRPIGRGLERYIDDRWGGPRGSAVARTRLIDDWVTDAVGRGARQVVVLGAGFDSRAHRLPALASVDVFEVDHPSTQATKRQVLTGRDVTFVPVDFLHDDLGTALAAAGLAAVPSVVVWEGVTNYLTAASVDATLRCLGALLVPGSEVVFTYVDRAVLDGGVADAWRGAVTAVGEPWTFGFAPAELADQLAVHGLELVEDLSTREAAARYGRPGSAATFYRIARAEVRAAAEGVRDAPGE